jgi:hypothetical protein
LLTARRNNASVHGSGSIRSKSEVRMSSSDRMLTRSLFAVAGIAALAGAFSLGVVVAQQPLPATKATQVMKQAITEFPAMK